MRPALPLLVGALAFAAGLAVQSREPANDFGQPVLSGLPEIVPNSLISQSFGCRIARLGQYPWDKYHARGDDWQRATRAALMSMGLPLDAANQVLHRIQMRAIDDLVTMSSEGAVSANRRDRYLPVMAMTYMKDGVRGVCFDTRLVRGSETAALYVVGPYHVALFQICGNLARLIPVSNEVEVVVPPRGPQDVPQGPLAVVHEVPEPASLWLVLAGIGAVFAARFKREEAMGD